MQQLDGPTVLRVDYDDADDLLADCNANLSQGSMCVANERQLPVGTEVQLVLAFPGLVEPIQIDGVVKWCRAGDEPTLGIEFATQLNEHLADRLQRIGQRDPSLVKRIVRVLVVEDNPHVAELVSHALGDGPSRGLGKAFTVECHMARDGREALQKLADYPFDAMIADVYLPVLDGPSLIAHVRSQCGPEFPIIAVSAGGDAARKLAIAAGANIFLDKPMRLRNVIDTVKSLMKLETA